MAEPGVPSGYGGSDVLARRLEALLARGGTKETIGVSREGRPVHAYRWGATDRPAVLLISLLHPMEWIGLEVHLALLERWLLRAPGPPDSSGRTGDVTGPPAPAILAIPVANPDGFARVEASMRGGRPRWIRGNAARVDLNRNFPVGHRARPSFLRWWPFYRPGPAPLSEPETAAIAHWIEGQPVRLSLSLHAYGRWIFVPPARSWRSLAATASVLAEARQAARGSGYRVGALGRWSPFFRARGTEMDFLHERTGAPAFLVEISPGGFARWGARRLVHPFYLFNPPRPQEEVRRLLPVLQRLVEPACKVP